MKNGYGVKVVLVIRSISFKRLNNVIDINTNIFF